MKEHLALLLRYEKWANKKILDAIKQLPVPDEKCLELMSHILLVQMVWYSRIIKQDSPAVWDKKNIDELYEMYETNNKVLDAFLSKLSENDTTQNIEYKNTKGASFHNSVKDILTHLFNHSTYHRGQIVERLKGKLPQMPSTDFIVFFRE
jgi:uncharacterized damage-inducible protein DinB